MEQDLLIEPYAPQMKSEWDAFVDSSKNATFLLRRDYMDYHSDRFADCSLMIRSRGKLVALLPASRHGAEARSHGGLTYGGLLMSASTGGQEPLKWFDAIAAHFRSTGIDALIYKPIPHIYHSMPAEEDLYALFRKGAELVCRNLATAIPMQQPMKASRLGKRAAKRARAFGITVEETTDLALFWDIIVTDRRERHNTTPVHSLEEMQRLHELFPQRIRLFVARSEAGNVMAGAVVFDTGRVLHLQYAAATGEGKEKYAVDVIYHELVFNIRPEAEWFDFGTSNEDAGRYLNEGMVAHKEEFGGRSIVYDSYRLDLHAF